MIASLQLIPENILIQIHAPLHIASPYMDEPSIFWSLLSTPLITQNHKAHQQFPSPALTNQQSFSFHPAAKLLRFKSWPRLPNNV